MRVVHPENTDSALRPKGYDIRQLPPKSAPIGVVKIQGINVLILFGRVFGVLDGTVGPGKEPPWMFADVGMVRGAVDGEIQSDLHAP
jgi:hypothetical protein